MTPDDRKYTRTHEWVKVEGTTATVGLADHAQKALGDITYVESVAPGKSVQQGGVLGVVESVKAASDIYAPLSGAVAEVNASLKTSPELVNKDPYGKGWIVKIRDVQQAGLSALLDASAYDALVKDEA